MNIRRSEILLLILILVSSVLYSILQLPAFNIICGFLLIILSIIYFGFGWIFFHVSGEKYTLYSIFSGIFYSIGLIGIYFKVNNFIGYNPLLLICWLVLIFILVPFGFLKMQHNVKFFNAQIFRCLLIGGVSAVLYFIDFL